MTIPSQSGLWSFAIQPSAFRDNPNGYNPAMLDFVKYRSPRIALSTIQDQQTFPLEVGGTIVPTGAFKQMQAYGGGVDLFPRMEESIGLLLYAALGHVSTVLGEDVYGNAVAGVNTHTFKFDPSSSFALPWLASRCVIPGATPAENFGETGIDCKIGQLTFTVPQMGKVAMRVDMMGREALYDNDPNSWEYYNSTFEPSESVPDAGSGHFKIGGVEYPALGASVTISNSITQPQQEMVIGSFHPDDIIPLTRAVSVQFTYKYENSSLAQEIFTGAADGTEFDALPFFAETVGSNYALDMYFEAPNKIGATQSKFAIRFRANKITLAPAGQMEMVAGGIMTQAYALTVIEPTISSDPYAEVLIQNEITGYASQIPGGVGVGATNPVLGFASAATYAGTPVILDPIASAQDYDADWGTLTATLAGTNYDNLNDKLDFDQTYLTIVTADIQIGGVTKASFVGDGKTAAPLVITFNGLTTQSDVNTILQAIRYDRTTANVAGHVVTCTLVLADIAAGSDTEVVTITHTA